MKDKSKITNSLANAKNKAERIIGKKDELDQLLNQTVVKVKKERQRLQNRWSDIEVLIKLIRAYTSGEYRRIPWKVVIAALVAIIYFINPFDVVPDVLGFVGFVDDVAVIAFVIGTFQEEIERFRNFLEETSQRHDLPAIEGPPNNAQTLPEIG